MDNRYVSITPLLQHLADSSATLPEIVKGIALIFHDKLSPIQCASLLSLLRATGRDQNSAVIAECAAEMRKAGSQVNHGLVDTIVKKRILEKMEGSYSGGVCTVEGTGGDGHSTFNVSTAAAIIASAVVLIAKHGANASSSKSGAADILRAIQPDGPILEAITPETLPDFYQRGNFGFLYSPVFHPGVKNVMAIRKELGFKTIFNILGPLAHPLNPIVEARVVGVAQRHLGPVYAEALRLSGVKKALIVCGAEDLDEISCAGPTFCWRLIENDGCGNSEISTTSSIRIEEFQLEPADFGLPAHPLHEIPLGKLPSENSKILIQMISGQLPPTDPTLHFVLMNTAALFVVAGVCDDQPVRESLEAQSRARGDRYQGDFIKEIGPGRGRWKEGARRARLALESGLAMESLSHYIQTTQNTL